MNKYLVIGTTFVDLNIQVIENNGVQLEVGYNIGGKGFNVAKGLGLLEKDVMFHTFAAKDTFGKMMVKELEGAGVRVTQESFTSNNTPIGCNVNQKGSLLFDKVDTSVFKYFPDLIIPKGITKIILFSHIPKSIFDTVIDFKKKNRNVTIYLSIAGSKDIPNIIDKLVYVDVLFANRVETETLLRETNSDSVLDLMEKFNIQEFISTRDSDGGKVYYHVGQEIIESSCDNYQEYKDPIVNTVGAGDALVSAYIAFRETFDPTKSLEKAMRVCAYHIRNNYSSLTLLPNNL